MSARDVWGYFPRESNFSVPPKRYLRRQSLPPDGVTNKKSPPPSKNYCGLAAGLIARIFVSESGVILTGIGFPPFLGVSHSGWMRNPPIHTPKTIRSYRTKMDDSGQQKTRFPSGIAGLYIKPDFAGRTTGGDAGNWKIDHQITFNPLKLFAFHLWVRFFMYKFSTQLFCLI
jgi:hypothetical protein